MTPLEELKTLLKDQPSEKDWNRLASRIVAKSWRQCWKFNGHHDRDGYPMRYQAGAGKRQHRVARRLAQLTYGDFGELVVDHVVCDNRGCVNPLHLIPCTVQRNSARSVRCHRKTCPAGHAKTLENALQNKLPKFSCRLCHIERERIRRESKYALRGEELCLTTA